MLFRSKGSLHNFINANFCIRQVCEFFPNTSFCVSLHQFYHSSPAYGATCNGSRHKKLPTLTFRFMEKCTAHALAYIAQCTLLPKLYYRFRR